MEEEPNVKSLPVLVKEWMTTEDELRTLSAEIREKRKRVKLVRQMIMKIMKGRKIGRLTVSSGAVTARARNTKAPMTKKYIVGALTEFFAGDKARAEACAAFLDEHRPIKVVEKLTLDPNTSP